MPVIYDKKINLILIKNRNSMKKMIKIAFVAAFAAIAGYGVYTNQKTDAMSDLLMANIEAIAGGESATDDCIYDPSQNCIYLHPTDPAKDEGAVNRRW